MQQFVVSGLQTKSRRRQKKYLQIKDSCVYYLNQWNSDKHRQNQTIIIMTSDLKLLMKHEAVAFRDGAFNYRYYPVEKENVEINFNFLSFYNSKHFYFIYYFQNICYLLVWKRTKVFFNTESKKIWLKKRKWFIEAVQWFWSGCVGC